MKTIQTIFLSLALAAFLPLASAPAFAANSADAVMCGGGEKKASVMTVTVKKVTKGEKHAEALKADLMKLNGVSEVSACQKSGTVKISYNKAELGCCSKIHAALKEGKWKYKMVSNQENPACTKGAKKECSGHKKGA